MAQQEASTSTRTVQGNSGHGRPVVGPGRSRRPETKCDRWEEAGLRRGAAGGAAYRLAPGSTGAKRRRCERGGAACRLAPEPRRAAEPPRLLLGASEGVGDLGLRPRGRAALVSCGPDLGLWPQVGGAPRPHEACGPPPASPRTPGAGRGRPSRWRSVLAGIFHPIGLSRLLVMAWRVVRMPGGSAQPR